MESNVKVIGVDPAPGKGSTVFDGKTFHDNLNPDKLIGFINELESDTNNHILICWDAPLTGPGDLKDGRFTIRPIEKFLKIKLGMNNKKKEDKISGLSIQGYSSCPHWTISRYVFGMPRFGNNNFNRVTECPEDKLPFQMATESTLKGNSIIEVHPALAMYLWLGELKKYKGREPKESAKDLWDELLRLRIPEACKIGDIDKEKLNDDRLDSAVAYMLGKVWTTSKDVELIGDKINGQILVPLNKQEINQVSFDSYIEQMKKSKGLLK